MKNHLIIGLGGTGGKVIRSFRKAIYREFRNDAPEGVHVGYLYMDSSSEMMALEDPSWKVLGHSVQLGRNSQLCVKGADLDAILDNLNDYPGIRPWIGDRRQWREIQNSIVGEALGGQKRRLGRFLTANRIDAFVARLRHLVNELEHRSGAAATTFHVCCGLAGGTGSGSLVDVVTQIRNSGFQNSDTHRVVLYALLPDENPPQDWNTGNYHANGYAALMELNALSVGALAPHDLTGRRERLAFREPFNGCYLFTDRNENGMTVDVDRVVPDIVADFLYQKIVAVEEADTWPRELRRMENAENGDGTPETAPATGAPERSKRFMTFGIKRLAVPEEEILEYMTYSFTAQSALQLLYNNWQDGLGFLDEPKNIDFKERVIEADLQLRWKLQDDHLHLSAGILAADAANEKWKPIKQEWEKFITAIKLTIRESGDKRLWFDLLEQACDKRFDEDFRALGVRRFYETKLRAKREMAREIRRIVEAELFEEWRTGRNSLHEIGRLLADLLLMIEERIGGVEEKQSRMKKREADAEKRRKSIKREWAALGIVGSLLRRNKLFDALADHLQEIYTQRTLQQGWDFGKRLLEEVREALNQLKSEVDECFSRLRQASDLFHAKREARCADTEPEGNLRRHLIRYYQPEQVKNTVRRLITDEAVQTGQTSGARRTLVQKLGAFPSFHAFNKHISVTRLMDTLETECEASAKRSHDVVIQAAHEKLLGVNIIERIQKRYGANDQDLRSFISELVGAAGAYATFDSGEMNKRGDGIPNAPTCLNAFTAIIPRSPEHGEFVERLKRALVESRPGSVIIEESDSRPNEITLISITNLFPLRFLAPLKQLEAQYAQRMTDLGAERATLEIHLENQAHWWPRLHVERRADAGERSIPYLLIAKALGIVREREHSATGKRIVSLFQQAEVGEKHTDLGGAMVDVVEALTPAQVNEIKAAVESSLLGSEYRHREKQGALIGMISTDLAGMKAERGMDDPFYLRCYAGAETAVKMIRAEE